MGITNIPFNTSNRATVYPFIEGTVLPDGLPNNLILEAHFIVDQEAKVTLVSITSGTADLVVNYLDGSSISVSITLVNNNWAGDSSNCFYLLTSELTIPSITTDIEFSPDTVYVQPKHLVTLSTQTGDVITHTLMGDITLKSKYNIETIVDNEDIGMPEITLSSRPGAGQGQVPCLPEEEPEEEPLLETINSVSADLNGNVDLTGDSCVRVTLGGNHELKLQSRCVACCECDDYWNVLKHIRAINFTRPSLKIVGLNLTKDIFEPVEGSLLEWAVGDYTLSRAEVPDFPGYYTWQIKQGTAILYFSSVTTGSVPLGCLWYLWYAGVQTDLISVDSGNRIYNTQPWLVNVVEPVRDTAISSSIYMLYHGINASYDGNREAYKHSVYRWNTLDLSVAASVSGWLSPGSSIGDVDGALGTNTTAIETGGYNYAVLGIKVSAGIADPKATALSNLVGHWLKIQHINDDESLSLVEQHKLVTYDGTNRYTDYSGIVPMGHKVASSRLLLREAIEGQETRKWRVRVGYMFAAVGSVAGSVMVGGTGPFICTETLSNGKCIFSNSSGDTLQFIVRQGRWIADIAGQNYRSSLIENFGSNPVFKIPAPWSLDWEQEYYNGSWIASGIGTTITPNDYIDISAEVASV